MAKSSILEPFILFSEGGYVNNPHDPGGATNKGITLKLWKVVGYDKNKDGVINEYDVKLINNADFDMVFKKEFWDKCNATLIENQSVANILVDWFYNSGYAALCNLQLILGLKVDCVIGSKTIEAINKFDGRKLFSLLWNRRFSYLHSLKGWKYSKGGWTVRMNSIKYGSLSYGGKVVKF